MFNISFSFYFVFFEGTMCIDLLFMFLFFMLLGPPMFLTKNEKIENRSQRWEGYTEGPQKTPHKAHHRPATVAPYVPTPQNHDFEGFGPKTLFPPESARKTV